MSVIILGFKAWEGPVERPDAGDPISSSTWTLRFLIPGITSFDTESLEHWTVSLKLCFLPHGPQSHIISPYLGCKAPWIPGCWFQPLWKIWKSIGMIVPNIWKKEKWSKPPTRYKYYILQDSSPGRNGLIHGVMQPVPTWIWTFWSCRRYQRCYQPSKKRALQPRRVFYACYATRVVSQNIKCEKQLLWGYLWCLSTYLSTHPSISTILMFVWFPSMRESYHNDSGN